MIAYIYRLKPSKAVKSTFAEFIEELKDLWYYLTSNYKCFIITGNFNIHFDSPDFYQTKKVIDVLFENNLEQIVDKPTHISSHILDWFVVPSNNCLVSSSDVINNLTSDHFWIILDCNFPQVKKKLHTVTTRELKSLNIDAFEQDISKNASQKCKLTSSTEQLNNVLRSTLDKHAPLRTRTLSERPNAFGLVLKSKKPDNNEDKQRGDKGNLILILTENFS
ncbi:ATP-dependent DNA helicase [Elysia marginata]|uniref:ATP-dependent DNA helicase n=1 Tax=Elysia marginata TaxID=1093978 RepID=A0AAV4FG99_9GAST|nr:ATP-dependent DNA helicase [Elysia marginata]